MINFSGRLETERVGGVLRRAALKLKRTLRNIEPLWSKSCADRFKSTVVHLNANLSLNIGKVTEI